MRIARPVAAFVIVTAAFTAPFWWMLTQHRGVPALADAGWGLMWAPAAAAFVVGNPRELGWAWPRGRFLALAFAIPIAYTLVAYVVAWAAGVGRFAGAEELAAARDYYGWTHAAAVPLVAVVVIASLTIELLPNVAYALGEELGWRGFLSPLLARRYSLPVVGLVSGVIWAAWHAPLFFFGPQHAGPPLAWQLGCFTVMATAAAVTLAYLRARSASVWPAALFHAVHNSFISACDGLTGADGRSRWILSETGLALALTATAAAIVVAVRFSDER
jgi:membrane protease YdiL (CAAX protease family)